jgi:hypothetical protein
MIVHVIKLRGRRRGGHDGGVRALPHQRCASVLGYLAGPVGIMAAGSDATDVRLAYDRRIGALRGRRVLAVDYWDLHNFGTEPARWDYGDWHHAVLGVQLMTDGGPVTVIWADTFFPYGVNVFLEPIEHHLAMGEFGPHRIGPAAPAPGWDPFPGVPIRDAVIWWERVRFGPSMTASGEVIGPPYTVDVPSRYAWTSRPATCGSSPRYPSTPTWTGSSFQVTRS